MMSNIIHEEKETIRNSKESSTTTAASATITTTEEATAYVKDFDMLITVQMNIHRSAHVHDTRREQRKEATTRSGATAPTERHCADKARHKKGSKTKSPFCVVLTTYHLTGIHHKTCLKHSIISSTENCVSNCYQHGTPWQQQGKREPKEKQNTPKRVETRFKTRQLQHAPSPDRA